MPELPPLIAHLRGDISHFQASMATATGVAKAETEASSSAFNKLANVGKFAFLGIAAGAIAGGAASIKMAGDFEQATTRLITSAGETHANIEMVRKGMLQMAGDVGYSAMDLAKAMYLVESAGHHGADGLVVLRAAAEGAKTENADLAVVANAVTTVLQDYHLKASDAALVTSKLVAGVSMGKTTFQELTGSLHSILPLASAMHVSLADIVGALASMTSHGVSAQQATENMAHALQHLQTITAPQAKELALLGISARKLSDDLSSKGLTGTLQEVSNAILQHLGPDKTHVVLNMMDALNKLSPEVQKLGRAAIDGSMTMKDYTKATKGLSVEAAGQAGQFATLLKATHGIGQDQKNGADIMQSYAQALKAATGDSTGLNVALMLTGENAGYTNDAVNAVANASTEAGNHVKGWADIQATFNQHMDRAREKTGALAISIGTALIPYAIRAMNIFTDFTDWLGKTQAVSIPLAVVIGGALTIAVGAYAIAMAGAAIATVAATWPLLAIMGAVGLLVAGLVILSGGTDKVRANLDMVGQAAQAVAKAAWPALKAAGDDLWRAIQPIIGSLGLLVGKQNDTAGSAKNLQQSVNDTRDGFVRFMTSDGVVGFTVWMAVTLPTHLRVVASMIGLLGMGVAQLLNGITTSVRAASLALKGDFGGAMNELSAGMERNKAISLAGAASLKDGLIAIQAEQDGTLERRERSFRDTMLHLYDTTKAGQISSARQAKEETLQQMREMHQQAVGGSIIPDMVRGILHWMDTLVSGMASVGRSMASGFVSGISSMAGDVARGAAKMVTDAINAAKAAAGNPHSPAPATIPLGMALAEGVGFGIRQGSPSAQGAMSGLIGGLSGGGSVGVSGVVSSGSGHLDDTNEILHQLLMVQQATYALLNRSRGMSSQAYGRTVASPS